MPLKQRQPLPLQTARCCPLNRNPGGKRARPGEHAGLVNANQNQSAYLLDLVKRAPDALDKLKPVIDAETALAELDRRIGESRKDRKGRSRRRGARSR